MNQSYYKTLALKHGDNIIRRIVFYPFQDKNKIVTADEVSYNQEGATEYLKLERSRWQASDQYRDSNIPMTIEIVE